jgi:hypothetical protein
MAGMGTNTGVVDLRALTVMTFEIAQIRLGEGTTGGIPATVDIGAAQSVRRRRGRTPRADGGDVAPVIKAANGEMENGVETQAVVRKLAHDGMEGDWSWTSRPLGRGS